MHDDTPSIVPSPNQAEEDDGPAKVDFPEHSDHEQIYTESEQTVTIKKQKDKFKEYLQPREGEITESEQTVTIKKQKDKFNEYLQPREGEITGTIDNSRKMFLVSLLPEINAMTENQMRVFRRKVLQLIDEISEVSDTVE
jgi:hypothetical protein